MSITDIILKRLSQTAVYWSNPTTDGRGSYTYNTAVEISCIWEETQKLVVSDDGKELTSQATVFVNQDLDIGGMLYLGDLDDLDSNPDPTSTSYEILSKEKLKSFNNEYVRRYYLGKGQI